MRILVAPTLRNSARTESHTIVLILERAVTKIRLFTNDGQAHVRATVT